MKRWLPVLLFAAALALMQWAGGGRLTVLPLITVAVFAVTIAAARLVRFREWVFRVPPGSRRARVLLFALFVRHFAGILGTEARRVLAARRMSVPRAWGRGGARSLVFAVAALLGRSLTRAERFYAAQWLRGLRP